MSTTAAPPSTRTKRIRLGLRDRVILGFGLLALVLSSVLAVVVWVLVSHFLVDQRVSTAKVDTAINAGVVQDIIDNGLNPSRVLGRLTARAENLDPQDSSTDWSGAVLYYDDNRFKASPSLVRTDLPLALTTVVRQGTRDQEQIVIDGERFVVAGVPLRYSGDAYFELFSMADVDQTSEALAFWLVGGVALSTLLGLWFGRFASRRALRPLGQVTDAAAAIARGDRNVRIDAVDDPDLGSLARSFNETAAALQRRVVADARFAGDVSHELRTPLTTMLNSMQLLQNRRSLLPARAREPLDLLAEDLERFRRLVVDLLEISRDDGGDPGARETIRIGDLVCKAANGAAGRPVTHVGEGVNGLTLFADKRRLERVVANLVENADIHGGGCTSVQVSRQGGRVRIEVDDNGPGVPRNRHDRIFERFARDSGDGPGVGLGLPIVARHVRAHGGSVTVEDRPGGGARFVVELPTSLV